MTAGALVLSIDYRVWMERPPAELIGRVGAKIKSDARPGRQENGRQENRRQENGRQENKFCHFPVCHFPVGRVWRPKQRSKPIFRVSR